MKSKVLIYDIEIVQRRLGDAWITMGADNSFITCFGYLWDGQKHPKRIDLNTTNTLKDLDPFDDFGDEAIVRAAHEIMSQADITVAHYGNGFDWKYMNAKFDSYELEPLSHIPKRDTCMKSRSTYKLGGNSLKNMAKFFKVTMKQEIDFKHWLNLYCHNESSMRKIGVYCEYDVRALADIYHKMQHHFPPVYHVGMANGDCRYTSCPECGSLEVMKRQEYNLASGVPKARMSCKACKRWFAVTMTRKARKIFSRKDNAVE